MPDMSVEELLMHHGVKGQRWGVRREQAEATSKTVGKRVVTSGKESLTATKSRAVKVGKFYGKHPRLAVPSVYAALFVAGHAVDVVRVGKAATLLFIAAYKTYNLSNLPPEQLAIGRKIVQGYVFHSSE